MLATAKIHILKQFTTGTYVCCSTNLLCLLLQRYTFWSNSQQPLPKYDAYSDCACYCKDTHFEAIHNMSPFNKFRLVIVLATAKIHILKQFTTRAGIGSGYSELCLLLQRYTFWSNSQLMSDVFCWFFYCACYCKDTHFEAIHNLPPRGKLHGGIVLATAKIHILKQFTTVEAWNDWQSLLCLLLQRYTFWSNSQPGVAARRPHLYCACYCKDTHFEAIHN